MVKVCAILSIMAGACPAATVSTAPSSISVEFIKAVRADAAYLISDGAHIGQTALHAAVQKGWNGAVQFLAAHGAELGAELDVKDNGG
jgi:hypothetical protein